MCSQLATLSKLFCELGIDCEKVTHPPLATALAADEIALHRPGVRLKNLFLRDNYGRRHILLITAHDAPVDLKGLSQAQQVSRLGFASDARLAKYLGVRPGCVSMLALLNDADNQVELWIDAAVWQSAAAQTLFHCHPFDNRQTWLMRKEDLLRLFAYWRHQPQVLAVPKRCGMTIKP